MQSQPAEPNGGRVIGSFRTHHMSADGRASFRIMTNGNATEGRLTDCHSSDHECSKADAGDRHQTNRDSANGDQAASQAADGNDSRRDIAQRDDASGMAASFIS